MTTDADETTDAIDSTAVRQAAARLEAAASTGRPCAPVRDLIGSTDEVAAYAVQRRVAAGRMRAGARKVGRKIGLTSPAVQQQLGVDQPDFGVLFRGMQRQDGARVPMVRLLQPRIEAEIAFVLDADLDDGPLDEGHVLSAVRHAHAALEIVDSRIADWDITFADTVADNGSSGLFVLGSGLRTTDAYRPAEAHMVMRRGGEVVSSGTGADCLGDPLTALAWLARKARELGEPLRAGEVVLSGALGPMIPVGAGDEFTAEISGIGSVSVEFGTNGRRRSER